MYAWVKDGSVAIMGDAALILTINFGIINFEPEKLKEATLLSLRIPIIASGGFLVVSVVAGGIAVAFLYELVGANPVVQKTVSKAKMSYMIQWWSFIVGLIFLFIALLIKLKVF